MRPWLILLVCIAVPFSILALTFYWNVRRRDLVRRPVERRVGYGKRKVLLIYQPSNRGKSNAIAWALARSLAKAGHTVTVNHPSPVLQYDPMDYDLLVFGGSAYMGAVGRPLIDYLSSLHFHNRDVLLFVIGDLDRAPEMAVLRLCVPAGNQVRSLKVRPSQRNQLIQFALGG